MLVVTVRSIAAALVGGAALGCLAAADDTERATEQSLFEEVAVVSASRVSQPISDAPGTISVITHDQLAATGARTLNDALRFVPGFDVRSSGSYQYAAIRGLGGNDEDKRVLWMVDGRPVNGVIRSEFNTGLVIDVDRIQQIEVIRGPGSALYGPNAFSGVVNIIMRPPGSTPDSPISFVAGDAGVWSPSVDVGWDKGKWQYGLSGMVHRWDSYVGHTVNDYDFMNQDEVSFRAAHGPLNISLGCARVNQGDSMELMDPATNESRRFGWYADAQTSWDLTARSSLALRASNWHENELLQMAGFEMTIHERLSLGELVYRTDLGQSHRLAIGTEYRTQLATGPTLGSRHTTNMAAFLQDTIALSPAWTATVGARYDAHSAYEDVLSPRIALIRRLSDRARIKASYGEAFRAPDLCALYANVPITETLWVVGNPDLRPERLRTFELGGSWRTSPSSSLDVNLFYTKARDLVLRANLFDPRGIGITVSENMASAIIYGGEMSLSFMSRSGNRSFVNYSYQHAEYGESGDQLEYAPAHKVAAGYAFDVAPRCSAMLLIDYVGERRTDASRCRWVGGYGVVDAIVRWQAPYGIDYTLGVYNLLDRRYEETFDFPIDGRVWRLRAALRY
jgi:outer membrane receptor for ferrienterochelin and colicin